MPEKPADYSEVITQESLHRLNVIQGARKLLHKLPDDPELHRQMREKLFDQAEHYKRIFEGLLEVIEEDLKKFPS